MIRTTRVEATDLEVGMYVSALDRDWLETPFLIQGFLIETREDIDRVRQYCQFVYVDQVRSRRTGAKVAHAAPGARAVKERPRIPIEKIFPGRKLKTYSEETTWVEEHAQAEVALDSLVVDI